MGDLQPIIDAILNDARVKAAEITEHAEGRAATALANFDAEKECEKKRFESELDKEIDRIYELEGVKGRQLVKTAILKVKSEFVKEAIVEAKKMLTGLNDNEYSALLSRIYDNCHPPEKGIVYLNERDRKRVKRSTFPTAKISDSSIDTDGGFVAVCGKVSYDCTFDSLFEEKYNEICDKINELCREVRV